MIWQYEGESDFDAMLRRRKEMKERLETDFEYRMKSVDDKLRLANAYAGGERYVRYKTTVIDTTTNDEYEIGIYGDCRLYTGTIRSHA